MRYHCLTNKDHFGLLILHELSNKLSHLDLESELNPIDDLLDYLKNKLTPKIVPR